MLEKVRYVDHYRGINVEAFTDGYAYGEYGDLYLLSVGGHDGNVKAITSAAVSGNRIQILSKEVIEAWAAFRQKYRIISAKMPGGLLHQLVFAESICMPPDGREKLLYVDGHEHPSRAVYQAVRSGYPVPLIPEWSQWLYETLRRENHVEELLGNRKVLRLRLNEELLDSLVSEGVRDGEITF
jgi:hypothetical protein